MAVPLTTMESMKWVGLITERKVCDTQMLRIHVLDGRGD
jgi:hypothetical protein